jgi:hypothetical protein
VRHRVISLPSGNAAFRIGRRVVGDDDQTNRTTNAHPPGERGCVRILRTLHDTSTSSCWKYIVRPNESGSISRFGLCQSFIPSNHGPCFAQADGHNNAYRYHMVYIYGGNSNGLISLGSARDSGDKYRAPGSVTPQLLCWMDVCADSRSSGTRLLPSRARCLDNSLARSLVVGHIGFRSGCGANWSSRVAAYRTCNCVCSHFVVGSHLQQLCSERGIWLVIAEQVLPRNISSTWRRVVGKGGGFWQTARRRSAATCRVILAIVPSEGRRGKKGKGKAKTLPPDDKSTHAAEGIHRGTTSRCGAPCVPPSVGEGMWGIFRTCGGRTFPVRVGPRLHT